MTINIKRLNFHLFEGEGGAEGFSLGDDARAFYDSLPGKDEYYAGNVESSPDTSTAEDNNTEPQTDSAPVEEKEQTLEEEFASLVGKGGKFHDIYGADKEQTIKDRLRNQGKLQAQVSSYEQATMPLFSKYGLEVGDLEGLTNAIASDDDLYQSGAEEAGLSVEEYKTRQKLEQDAEFGRRMRQQIAQERANAEMYAQWESESGQLQEAFPNFDLANEMNANEQFVKLITSGISVQDAFFATHMQEIMQGYGQEAQQTAESNVINNIQSRAARPTENAMSHTPAIKRTLDPASLSDDDIDEIIKRVQSGDKFRF